MADEIEIRSRGEDGHAIRGNYRVAAEVIYVRLSDGTSTEASVGSTPPLTLAKIILQELDRKSRTTMERSDQNILIRSTH